MKKQNLKGKFVIAYDTLCDGWQCMLDENEKPVLFDSENDAFLEIFDSNFCMLKSHEESGSLVDLNKGVTSELIIEMESVYDSKDVSAMRKFMNEHPECDDSGEWVEPADEFIMGRKTFIGEDKKGNLTMNIEGNKL